MTISDILVSANKLGFSHTGELNTSAMRFLPEVRDMCASDRCHSYGKSWTCPPHCGTLEEISAKAAAYSHGILVQSTGLMEDDFDLECMMETEQLQKSRFFALVQQLWDHNLNVLPLSSGACTVCKICTCPDNPCRFPDKAIPSMEACGLVVSDICKQSELPYYYGPKTMTYTSCILFHLP